MDILTYEYMLKGLKEYNNTIKNNYGNVVVEYPTKNTTFPHTVFEEIRNVQNPNFKSRFDRVASIGYRTDIYAKTKGSISKKNIARQVANIIDEYLSNIGLNRVSYNVSENEENGTIYHIIMTYSGNLHENRRNLI